MAKLFLIESNPVISKLIYKAIKDAFVNTQILTFDTIEKALGNVHEKPDYIILDHLLDKIHGVDSIPVFKEFLPNAAIVVASSQNDIEVFESAFLLGASEYIRKDGLLIENIIAFLKKDMETPSKKWFNSVTQIFKNDANKKEIKSIYVLDDNLSTSYFTQHILQFESYNTVLLFSNVNDFLLQVNKLNPDVAILEYNLENNKQEINLVKELKQISPATNVLIFSDQTDVKIASELIRSGASHYLIKSQKNILRLKTILS